VVWLSYLGVIDLFAVVRWKAFCAIQPRRKTCCGLQSLHFAFGRKVEAMPRRCRKLVDCWADWQNRQAWLIIGDKRKKKKRKKKKKSTKKQLDNLEHTILELELDGRVDTTRCRAKFVELSNERRALVSALQIEPPKRREIAVNLTVQEARTLQKVSEREQDALLEGKRSRSLFCSFFPGLFSDLGGSLQRQQHIGLQIGKTVEEQQPLIDRVAARTGRSDAKVQREIQRIEEFEVGKCSIVAWIVVFFLAAVLIVLLATDGGCKILFSSSYCANRPWLSRPNATS
jgi:hypothetical protein